MRLTKYLLVAAIFILKCDARAIMLTEIMFNPEGEESSDEFIELYNESSLPVNLSGWMLSDGEGTDTLADAGMGLIAGPRQYVLIIDPDYIEDGSTAYNGLIPETALIVTISNSTFGSRGLSNSSAETVSIMHANENIIAEFSYDISIAAGHSNEKILLTMGDTNENWGESIGINGTPGFRNSITPPDHDLAIRQFVASPQYPEANEDVLLSITIENLGLNTASNTLHLHELESQIGDTSELIESWDVSNLASGDTLNFTKTLSMNDLTVRFLQAKLFADDDVPANNTSFLTIGAAASEGTIIINEIMYQPSSGRSEWLELYNNSPSAVVLDDWTIADGSGIVDTTKRFILESVIMDTNSYLLLASDSSIFLEDIAEDTPVLIWNSSYPSLNNAGDSLVLYDAQSDVVDRVDYQASWGNGAAGFSLERVSKSSASNDPLNWASSLDPSGGTPGRINSRALPDITADDNLIVLEPNPFSPDGDGKEDILAIRYHLEEADSRLDIKIFDVRGRQVRFLSNNLPAGYHGEVLWDGKSDSGRLLPTGMYIIYLEALGQGGNRIQSGRRVVALARPS